MWVVFWGRVGKIPVGRTFKGLYVVGVSVVKGRENLAVSAELEGGGGVE